ncbi:MAG: GNAT family N-acetyltransferase [Elusimicrobiales bacterium]
MDIMENFEIVAFDPLTADGALWEKFFDHTEAIYREYEPEEPMLSRARKKEMTLAALPHPYMDVRFYLALAPDGRPAGYANTARETPASPSYKDNAHIGYIQEVSVLPAFRRRGLGTALLRRAVRDLKAAAPAVTEVTLVAFREPGQRFAGKHGAALALTQAENRLYFKDLDWAMVERWAAEGAARNPATRLLTVPVIPEEDIADFALAYTETINQAPQGDMGGRQEITPEAIRRNEKRTADQGAVHLTVYTREADGRVSGLTETAYVDELGFKARQLLTGVRREFRGRGLGKWLKAAMLLHLRRDYPGVKYIATANADSNAPMLAINSRLGFRRHMPVNVYKLKITPELAGGE